MDAYRRAAMAPIGRCLWPVGAALFVALFVVSILGSAWWSAVLFAVLTLNDAYLWKLRRDESARAGTSSRGRIR